jgi:eukaryotic-like serine/threonine-protein kinase
LALTLGARFGPYEILAALGAGGMGEVYRARDTRLNREVALKVLPDAFANDPERLARFQREAQVLASLNHPNIAHIHGLEESGGVRALVMELVEGEDLAQRIAHGPIPLDEALPMAKQIAEALEAAHERGIIHRDLKPANIKLRPEGTVKVLDFGLAKAMEPLGTVSNVSQWPTLTTPAMTEAGIILGTAAYMSPEQARGRPADKRADVWGFGVVLYEMLTGRQAFEGETISDVLAKVIEREPDWAVLPASTPPGLRQLLRRCARKDPKTRLQAMGDARVQIEELISGATEETATAVATQPRIWRRARFAWTVAALSLPITAALAIPATLYLRRVVPERLPARFEIPTPPTSDPVSFALSADGRQLAFVATAEGVPRLWVRPLDQVTAQPLAGTEGASYPFWAPDGRAIGFFADGKLKRIDLGSGVPQVLADAPSGRGGTWNRDGVVVFAPTAIIGGLHPLMRVMSTGGTPVAATRHAPGQGSHRWPQFLPDGRHFLFFMAYGRPETQGIYVGTLDGGEATRVLSAETAAVYAPPGALLWVRQGVLVAHRFDPANGVVTGEAIPIAQAVGSDEGVLRGAFAVATGVLAHRAGGGERRQLVWVDRAGIARGTVGPADEGGLSNPELSPDGRRVAVNRTMQGNTDVWLIEVGRGVASRFTFAASNDGFPLWSPDGRRLVFGSEPKGVYDLVEKPLSGGGDEQPLLVTAEPKNPLAWSPDGRLLLYATQHPKTGTDLWALPLAGERKPFPVVQTPFEEVTGQFSPDGRWVAYQSNESGPMQIYVRPFPGPGGQWQLSTTGGKQPRWRPDGKELFYVAPDARLMAVPIAAGADNQTLEAGAPVPLFSTRLASGANVPGGVMSRPQYAVASDGRFLMNVAVEGAIAPPITVVLNWDAALKK